MKSNRSPADRGYFVTVEGSEGAGKSTNLTVLMEELDKRGIAFHSTREPGGTEMAEEIRNLILTPRSEAVDGLSELLMMFAARRQHVVTEIQPRLQRGEWVLCDRFTDATYAYQGYGRGLNLMWIDTLRSWVQQGLEPDLTLYFDVPPEVGAARISDRDLDRMEQERQDFFARVRDGYLQIAKEQSRMEVIDASRTLDQVGADVRSVFQKFVSRIMTEN